MWRSLLLKTCIYTFYVAQKYGYDNDIESVGLWEV